MGALELACTPRSALNPSATRMAVSPVIPTVAPFSAARPAFAPAHAVWNHPVKWISVHKQGL